MGYLRLKWSNIFKTYIYNLISIAAPLTDPLVYINNTLRAYSEIETALSVEVLINLS